MGRSIKATCKTLILSRLEICSVLCFLEVTRNSNRGVSISRPPHGGQGKPVASDEWRVARKFGSLRTSGQEIAKYLRLDLGSAVCFLADARNSNSRFAIRSDNSQGRLEGDGSSGRDREERPFDSRWSLRMTILFGLSFAIRNSGSRCANGRVGRREERPAVNCLPRAEL